MQPKHKPRARTPAEREALLRQVTQRAANATPEQKAAFQALWKNRG